MHFILSFKVMYLNLYLYFPHRCVIMKYTPDSSHHHTSRRGTANSTHLTPATTTSLSTGRRTQTSQCSLTNCLIPMDDRQEPSENIHLMVL